MMTSKPYFPLIYETQRLHSSFHAPFDVNVSAFNCWRDYHMTLFLEAVRLVVTLQVKFCQTKYPQR